MNRNDVFLEAMGLGPQWKLRHGPAAVDGEFGEADMTVPGDERMAIAAPAAHMPAAAPQAMEVDQPAMAQYASDAQADDRAMQAAAPAASPPAVSAPAAESAPPAARPAPSGGEDTSWFDDAPAAPSTRPALKSQPPAKAPPPARPAGNAPASPAAQAGGESYDWFDKVPATPIAKSVRKAEPEPELDDEPRWREQPPAGPAATRSSPPAHQGAPDRPGMPGDGIPWFDDAPLPSFDAAFDDLYGAEDVGLTAAAIARMDWPALRAAVQSCTRCALCQERSAAVPGRGPEQAPWLVLATAPNGDDEAQARALTGAPGQLLDNMLKAIKVAPEQQAYVATLVKCRPQGDRAPTADEVAACRPYLDRELALAGSRAVITLGHTAAKGLLGAAARGKVLRLGQIPVVATYHPADLLRKPEDKAKAWADLCLARAAFDGRA